MNLSNLQEKVIVNMIDGKNVGYIVDFTIDDYGKIIEVTVQKKKFFFSLFSKKELSFSWNQIKKIGEDVIFVNIE